MPENITSTAYMFADDTKVYRNQTYQVSRISRETHAFRPTLTLTRPRNEISRMAVNVTYINNMREISYVLLEIFTQFSIYYNITDSES